MYSLLHETDDATSVNFSAWGNFLAGSGNQLVTVGSKCVKIYRLNPFFVPFGGADPSTRLECLLSFTLMAPVRSLAVVRLKVNPVCHALAMTFDDAKLSIVSVNPATMTLNTISLHSIEDEFLRDGYTDENIHQPELRADPDNRCCAFTVYGRHLAVVPFSIADFVQQQQTAKEDVGGKQHQLQQQMLLQSYTVKLRSLDEGLDNILDMCFLHGYYEPTLLFLYEPIQTTAGRASVRFDTVAILAVSMNIKDHVHAVVWHFAGLPMTVARCVPIRVPIGGVCLIGANEIVYLNQSVPPRGISLNSCADEFSRFPLNDLQHMRLSLDGSAIQALDSPPNDLVIVLRNGDLFTDHQSIRHVNTLHTDRFAVEQPITKYNNTDDSVHCAMLFDDDDNYLYGNDFCNSFHLDETLPTLCARRYNFEVVDSLTNIGPCKWLRTCSASFVSDVFLKRPRDIFFDMMTVSGHGKNSSLCFFHCSIRPQIIASTVLDDALQIWTVGRHRHVHEMADGEAHKFLVISRERSSVVLELANDNMVELDTPCFCQTETTVAVGELAHGAIVVQRTVTPTTVLLVSTIAAQQLEVLTVDSNFPVISASISDPFVVLLTLNGRFILYRLNNTSSHAAHLQQIPVLEVLRHAKSPITAICMYRDESGLMELCVDNEEEEAMDQQQPDNVLQPLALNTRLFASRSTDQDSIDGMKQQQEASAVESSIYGLNVDAFLYGDDDVDEKSASVHHPPLLPCTGNILPSTSGSTSNLNNGPAHDSSTCFGVQPPDRVKPTYWLFFARENGNLYVYSVPELRLCFIVKKLSHAHEVLYGDAQTLLEDDHRPAQHAFLMNTPVILPQVQSTETARVIAGGAGAESMMLKPEEVIFELFVHGMGINKGRPVLSVLVDDQMVFYEMFRHDDHIAGQLSIRFRRLPSTVVVREQRFLGPNGRAPVEAARDAEQRQRSYICPFERVGQLSNGLFIGGGYPSLLVCEQSGPCLRPMTVDGPLASFASFHNSSTCRHGFLYLTRNEHLLRIATLADKMDYGSCGGDLCCALRKSPIEQTVRHCVYLLQPGIFALILTEQQPNQKQCSVVNEEKQMETFERDDNFILPSLDSYTLKLFSTEDWAFVPNEVFQFDEFEVVTCCEEALLNSESTVSGVQNYLAIGTAINYGEEVYVRGRVLLFELVEVVPEEGRPTTRHRLKTVYDKEQKGAVTSLCAVNGFLLTGMGQKVFIWQFRDNQLNGVSFLDLHFYVHHMTSFRELALVCDLYRSLSLIRYQEEFKALSLVSRDLRPTAPAPMTAQFLVDHRQLGFVLTDELANVTLFNYLPETKESIGGERLIIKAALNIGSLINSIVRVKGHGAECLVDAKFQQGIQTCFFATLDGSLGYIRPLTEKAFRRLHMLQQVMNLHVPQPAGLNSRGSRAARPQRTGTHQQISLAKNIVDGLLVMQYLHLSVQDKTDLARKLGTSRYQIIDDLTELCRTVTHH
uniref:Cleavage and polyadenylation specificity factor subunit 1 n=1 Tax=Globodera rostochiensis TaxID=31243 RepID=A0A914IGJ2_GLORO